MSLVIAFMHYTETVTTAFALPTIPVGHARMEMSLLAVGFMGLMMLTLFGYISAVNRRLLVDIGECKGAEEKAAESEERYRSLIQNAKDVIFTLAPDGTVTSINPVFEAITGWSRDEWIGKPFMPLVHPDDLAHAAAMFQKAMDGGQLETFEVRITRKRGDYLIGEFTVTQQTLKGAVAGILGIGRDVTERKRIEAAGRKNDLLLREVMDHSPAIMFLKDPEGRYLQINRQFESVFQVTRDEMLGKCDTDIFPANQAAAFRANDQTVLEAGVPMEFEEVALHDGGLHTCIVSKFPLRDGEGHIYALCGIATDITERKRTEAALKKSETRIRAVLETALDAIVGMDEHGRITDWNPRAEVIFGWTRDEVVGRSLSDTIIPLQFREAHARAFQRFLAAGAGPVMNRRIEVIALRRDGTEFPAELSISAMRLDDSWAFNAFIADITDRKRAEEALRASEERFELVARATNDAVWDWNLVTNSHWGHEGFETLFGVNAQDGNFDIEAWSGRIHPEEREAVLDHLYAAIESGEAIWSAEYRFRRADGSYAVVYDRGYVLHNEQGKPVRMIGAMMDITERKQTEAALRSSELQLRQAQKMEAVGRLAGGVAHDFNNLLTVIRGHSELLTDSVTMNEDERRSVEQINQAAQRAVSLTSQLLAFSRKQMLQPQILDLNDVVQGMDTMLRRLIGEDIELTTVLQAEGRIHADKGQIEQVIMNLAVNARDAMPRGGRLTIETRDIEIDSTHSVDPIPIAAGAHVQLTVSDVGCGMDAATQTQIFEPFFTTKPNGQGTGLGLSTVYGIVKQSGGTIAVYSEVGQGTSFKIYLPRLSHQELPSSTSEQNEAAPMATGTETILLAEDEEMVRTLTTRALVAGGYTVLLAGNGDEALAKAHKYAAPISLLVTDVVMPGMSGRELSERLSMRHPETKVLYMSGYTDDAIIRHGVLKAGTAFIQKPYSLGHLLRKIREVLDENTAAARAADMFE